MKKTILSAASAALALALVTLPAAAAAQGRGRSAPARSAGGGAHIAGLFGFESGFGDTAPALRLDGEWDLQPLSTGRLGIVGSAGFTFFGDDDFGGDFDVNTLKLSGAVRWTVPVAPELDVYADGGLGFYVASFSVEDRLGREIADDTEVGLLMRFAGGLMFHATDRLRLGGELGLNPYFGDLDDTTFSLMAALSYRL
jgi:hypothetical protein